MMYRQSDLDSSDLLDCLKSNIYLKVGISLQILSTRPLEGECTNVVEGTHP